MQKRDDLNKQLEAAANLGLITRDQVSPLQAFFAESPEVENPENESPKNDRQYAEIFIEEPRDEERLEGKGADYFDWAETPRLIRGFHDILISIGIVSLSIGAALTISPAFLFISSWIMAEYFVRHKRLALPGFTLTIIFSVSIGVLVTLVNLNFGAPLEEAALLSVLFFAVSAALLLFFYRFRTPISFSLLVLSMAGCLYGLFLAVFVGNAPILGSFESLSSIFVITTWVFAVAILALSLWFDLRDLRRRTVGSDIAFWLYFVAVPAFLYSSTALVTLCYALIFHSELDFAKSRSFPNELMDMFTVFSVILVFVVALIGLVIDRRAFVSGGLLALGGAAYYFFDFIETEASSIYGLAILVVGVFVLLIGSVWDGLRLIILRAMPPLIRSRVRSVEMP